MRYEAVLTTLAAQKKELMEEMQAERVPLLTRGGPKPLTLGARLLGTNK